MSAETFHVCEFCEAMFRSQDEVCPGCGQFVSMGGPSASGGFEGPVLCPCSSSAPVAEVY